MFTKCCSNGYHCLPDFLEHSYLVEIFIGISSWMILLQIIDKIPYKQIGRKISVGSVEGSGATGSKVGADLTFDWRSKGLSQTALQKIAGHK